MSKVIHAFCYRGMGNEYTYCGDSSEGNIWISEKMEEVTCKKCLNRIEYNKKRDELNKKYHIKEGE